MDSRRSVGKLVVCATLALCAPLAMAMEVDINFLLGGKALDEDDWGEADSQGAFGVETTFGQPEWPVAIALDYFGTAYSDDVLVTSPPATVDLVQGTVEFDFGVRKVWKVGRARPFIGGGLGFLGAYQERVAGVNLLTVDDSDGTVGAWFNGGAFWRLGKRFNIGVDLRLSGGEVTLFEQDVQVGGATLSLLLGWGWGGGGS